MAAADDSVLREALLTGVCMGLPGVAVAIATEAGLLWEGSEGVADIKTSAPMRARDRFCVGSITKTFVAVVVLQLAEEGKLDLETKLIRYLDGDVATRVRRVPNASVATLHQILSHQSGIPTWEFAADWIRKGRGVELELGKVWEKDETLQFAEQLPPTGEPGHSYSYSNTNYTLLGLVIEAVTGNDVAVEIRRRVLEPLELKDTYLDSFEASPRPGPDGRALSRHYHSATPHYIAAAGGLHPSFANVGGHRALIDTSAANLSPEWAAGGLVASMGDLALYTAALRGGDSLLSAATRERMFEYRPPASSEEGDDGSGHPSKWLPEDAGVRRGQTEYCMGIMRTREYGAASDGGDILCYGHWGGTLGFSARMWWEQPREATAVAKLGPVVCCATNIGSMHSGFEVAPFSLWNTRVLAPAVRAYLASQTTSSHTKL